MDPDLEFKAEATGATPDRAEVRCTFRNTSADRMRLWSAQRRFEDCFRLVANWDALDPSHPLHQQRYLSVPWYSSGPAGDRYIELAPNETYAVAHDITHLLAEPGSYRLRVEFINSGAFTVVKLGPPPSNIDSRRILSNWFDLSFS